MRRAILACLLFAHPALAAPDCTAAAAIAEAEQALPPGLLAAIGRVESGRADPLRGVIAPWPFSVNAGGEGHVVDSAAAAGEVVLAAMARGVRSIDVGCFQINLLAHPDAFATLAEGFDPLANARYAARLLAALHQRGGDWPAAVALYHSATPGLGEAYRARVLAAWTGGADRAGIAAVPVDRVAVRLAPAALAMLVIRPGDAAPARPDLPRPDLPRPALPRVFTPTGRP